MERAIYLAEEALILGLAGRSVDELPAEYAKYLAVSDKDIVAIANRYFTVEKSISLNIKQK
jgi:hypothetical protein